MKISALVAALFGIAALASPAPAPAPPAHDHSLERPTKIGQRHEEVQATPDKNKLPEGASAAAANLTGIPTHILKRGDTPFSSYYCGGPWAYTPVARFYSGLSYLRGINQPVHLLPGPGKCDRVSCDKGAAVYVCNDWAHQSWVDSFDRIADALSFVIGKCTGTNGHPGEVAGQVFHKDNWNVIVRWDDGCKPGYFGK